MLREVLQTYPQPIAQAYGRVVRSIPSNSRLDAILRTAEVTARYVAGLGIASYAARDDEETEPPASFVDFRGNLAFGSFVNVAKEAARLATRHPLAPVLSQTLLKKTSPFEDHLDVLLRLRNDLGHDLRTLNEGRAAQILDGRQPDYLDGQRPEDMLEALLLSASPICALPLVFVGEVSWGADRFDATCLFVMGEGEPVPEVLHVGSAPPFPTVERLYVGARDGMLPVHPKLLWDYEPARATQSVYIVDRLMDDADEIGYRSVSAEGQPMSPPPPSDLLPLLEGSTHVDVCEFALHDGRQLSELWWDRRDAILSGQDGRVRTVDWGAFDGATLAWYSTLLGTRHELPAGSPAHNTRDVLLDGRGEVNEEELRQLHLLFGRGEDVGRTIKRPVVDLRVRLTEEGRWDAREEVRDNVLVALRRAVDFLAQHDPGVNEELQAEGLQETVGSADYLAAREALVNLFAHQDYGDERLAGQIELVPYQSTFINAGHALINEDELLEGGNLSRNPLIARALKLIGFAELAGSGLRELDRTWRLAGRPRPRFRSDRDANRFRLTLDSRAIEPGADEFWLARLGVEVSPEEGDLLRALADAEGGLTREGLAERAGTDEEAVAPTVRRFVVQGLATEQGGRVVLRPDLVELVQQDRDADDE